MFEKHTRRYNIRLPLRYGTLALIAFCLALAAFLPYSAFAFKVKGKLTNGTTGRTDISATVELVNPHAGMHIEQKLEVTEGTFTTDNLSDTVHVYLLRIRYNGISYSELVHFQGIDPVVGNFEVYDSTSSLENVHVSILHMMARRLEDRLRIDKIFEITNASDPPRTVVGKRFAFYIPEDRKNLNALYVTEHGIPLKKEPIPTETEGIYRIDYPLKPGVTRMALSFDVPYADGAYTYRETLQHDIATLTLLTEDPDLQISSETIPLEKDTDAHGFAWYSESLLPKSSVLSIRFSGGSKGALPSSPNESRVIILSNMTRETSILLIAVLALVIFGFAAFKARIPAGREVNAGYHKLHSDRLFTQIAKLDDLHAAGTIPEMLYREKRAELKSRLVRVLLRLNTSTAQSSHKSIDVNEGEK